MSRFSATLNCHPLADWWFGIRSRQTAQVRLGLDDTMFVRESLEGNNDQPRDFFLAVLDSFTPSNYFSSFLLRYIFFEKTNSPIHGWGWVQYMCEASTSANPGVVNPGVVQMSILSLGHQCIQSQKVSSVGDIQSFLCIRLEMNLRHEQVCSC